MSLSIEDGESVKLNIIYNKTKSPVYFERREDHLWLTYSYNKPLTDYFKKTLVGCKWHGFEKKPIKQWSIGYCEHNLFRLEYMSGANPYEFYDKPLEYFESKHPLKPHQKEMAAHFWTRRKCISAFDPGLGKSLATIATIEHLYETGRVPTSSPVFWVATKSALISVQLEYLKWSCSFPVRWHTYDSLKKYMEEIEKGTKPPRIIIGDEAHRLKHVQSKRSKCFNLITRCMRTDYGDDCYIMLMSGTCSPKSPLDWHSQVDITRPGFVQEGTIFQFKDRLAIIEQREGASGSFPELIAWRDRDDICEVCGQVQDNYNHNIVENYEAHAYKQGINEVANLYKRMNGLVLVRTKKECTDLPDKIYRRIYCKSKPETLRAMKLLSKVETSAIKVLTRCRQLSDGFLYNQIEDGTKVCELCKGSGQYVTYNYCGPQKTQSFIRQLISELTCTDKDSENQRKANMLQLELESNEHAEDIIIDFTDFPQFFKDELGPCPHCDGEGNVPNIIRSYTDTKTTKDQALIDIMEDHDDIGRLAVFAGFTASIDRLIGLITDQEWDFIKVDGRGWSSSLVGKPPELLRMFQDTKADNKIVFLGHPGSAGTGLTLTASPTIVYYSNDFSGEARMQSEDRIHRLGMDENRGATIIDLIHLPSDEYVLDNLLKKKRLQDMTLGQVTFALEANLPRIDYE